MQKLIEEHVIVPSNNVMRIQESHLFLTHYLAELIEKKLILHRNDCEIYKIIFIN